jgi:hypothetical protein
VTKFRRRTQEPTKGDPATGSDFEHADGDDGFAGFRDKVTLLSGS